MNRTPKMFEFCLDPKQIKKITAGQKPRDFSLKASGCKKALEQSGFCPEPWGVKRG